MHVETAPHQRAGLVVHRSVEREIDHQHGFAQLVPAHLVGDLRADHVVPQELQRQLLGVDVRCHELPHVDQVAIGKPHRGGPTVFD